MDLDQLAPGEHPHQAAVGSGLDPVADQVPGDRVQRPGHLNVVVPVHLGLGVGREVVDVARGGRQAGLLFQGEQLGGRHWIVPWVRIPARTRHHSTARRWASSRPWNVSPAKKLFRTNGTVPSTLGLSVGVRTRAGSTRNPRVWAYSMNAWLNRGANGSLRSTIAFKLSGITTANTPPKKAYAASIPAITSPVVCRNVNHTNVCRE